MYASMLSTIYQRSTNHIEVGTSSLTSTPPRLQRYNATTYNAQNSEHDSFFLIFMT